MKPCLSQTLTLPSSFAEDVDNYLGVGCTAMEVWLTKLEQHLESHSATDTRKRLADLGLNLPAAAYQGGLLLSQGEERRAHHDHFRRRLGLCQEFGIGVLLVVADFTQQVTQTDLDRAGVSLVQAAQLAATYGVRLGLEFRGSNRWCASLDTALALVDACGQPNLGVVFDVFHYYTGPSKLEDLRFLTTENLAHVQLCDLAGTPRELAGDADRILPGEGDFLLGPILEHLRVIGYEGHVSVELFNPDLWRMKPVQVAEAALTALRRLLGVASMGDPSSPLPGPPMGISE
jgi:sugar phosphate isomerase/epimerase